MQELAGHDGAAPPPSGIPFGEDEWEERLNERLKKSWTFNAGHFSARVLLSDIL